MSGDGFVPDDGFTEDGFTPDPSPVAPPARPSLLKRALQWTGETAADAVNGANRAVSTLGAPLLAGAGAAASYALPGAQGSPAERWRNEMETLRRHNAESDTRSPLATTAGAASSVAFLPVLPTGVASSAGIPSLGAAVQGANVGRAALPLTMAAGLTEASALTGLSAAAANADRAPLRSAGEAAGSPWNLVGAAAPVLPLAAGKAADAAERWGISAGRRALSPTRNMSVVKPVSEQAVLEADRQGAFLPNGTKQGAADSLDAAAERFGNEEYGAALDRLEAKGVKGTDKHALAKALQAKGQGAFNNTGMRDVRRLYDRAGTDISAVEAGTPGHVVASSPVDEMELPLAGGSLVPGPEMTRAPDRQIATEVAYQQGLPLQREGPPTNAGPGGFGALGTPRHVADTIATQIDMFGEPLPVTQTSAHPVGAVWQQGEPVAQSVAYQPDLLPPSQRYGGSYPPRSDVEFVPADERLGVRQQENIKRAYQGKAHYDRVQGDTVQESARKDIASTVRQANEDAIMSQYDLAPDEAGAFVPMKLKMGNIIEARDAADIAAARAANKHHVLSPYNVIAAATAAGPVDAAARVAGMHWLQTRGPSTAAWSAFRTRDAARAFSSMTPEAARKAALIAALYGDPKENDQ